MQTIASKAIGGSKPVITSVKELVDNLAGKFAGPWKNAVLFIAMLAAVAAIVGVAIDCNKTTFTGALIAFAAVFTSNLEGGEE